MRTRILLTAACLLVGRAAAQYLFYNQGALVHVQPNALLYVQGGMQINDVGANNGVVNNYGTIELRDGAAAFVGHLLINQNAELNSYPNSNIYIERDYHNNEGYHRCTPSAGYGGTIHFVGPNQPQAFRIDVSAATQGNSENWALNDVVINKTNALPNRYVEVVDQTDRDMWIAGKLTLTQGRIITSGSLSGGGGPTEVRILSNSTTALVRTAGNPVGGAPNSFDALLAGNEDGYIQGYLRRNTEANQNYQFPVGGDAHGLNARGIQQMDVRPSADHWVRVRFITLTAAENMFNQPAYCRPPDNANRSYLQLNNGYWEVMPFSEVDATSPSNPTPPASITMHNRVVTNGTSNGNCPNQGATNGLPGGSDPVWTHYPSNRCYIAYNRNATPATGNLTPPNNCEGSNNGWTVSRTLNAAGFTQYNQNGSYFYGTVIAWNAPLPSDDIRLSARPTGSAIALTWEVTPEREHVLGYNLERSTDGIGFTHIAQIDRQGRVVYHHRDEHVELGVRYFYRVAQHDALGQVRYSNVVEAILPKVSDGDFEVNLHPQPFMGEGYLQVSLPTDGVVAMQVYDAAGRLVLQQSYNLTAGIHRIDLSGLLSQVAPGNYNAVFTFGELSRTLRMIKADPSQ